MALVRLGLGAVMGAGASRMGAVRTFSSIEVADGGKTRVSGAKKRRGSPAPGPPSKTHVSEWSSATKTTRRSAYAPYWAPYSSVCSRVAASKAHTTALRQRGFVCGPGGGVGGPGGGVDGPGGGVGGPGGGVGGPGHGEKPYTQMTRPTQSAPKISAAVRGGGGGGGGAFAAAEAAAEAAAPGGARGGAASASCSSRSATHSSLSEPRSPRRTAAYKTA